MSSQNSNPFILPGFGQANEMSSNPLLASMEMLSRAWQSLAGSGVLSQPPVPAALTTEDLDRRINDLKAVENWLRINMSMLTSSIQALEVQRATIATLKSFANVPGTSADGDNPSPLEVVLGIKPSGQAKIKTAEPLREQAPAQASATASGQPGAEQAAPLHADPAAMSEAAQGWWNMLQKQFDTLAAATVAGMQASQPAAAQGETAGPAKRSAAPRKATGKASSRQASVTTKKAATSAQAQPAVKRRAAKKAGATPARKRVIGSGRTS